MRYIMAALAAPAALAALAALGLANAAQAQELTGTLKKVHDTRTITMGVRDSSVPFSYLDGNQKPVGYAIDICLKVVEAIKTELKLPELAVVMNPVTSSTRIPLMANGTIDLECGSTTNNAERQKQVAFSNTYFLTASKYLYKRSAGLATIDSLKGKSVVSTSGTTNIVQLNKVNTERGLGINVLAGKDHAESFLLLETGRAVAFVMDDVLLASLAAAAKEPGAYAISDDAFSQPEPYAIMLRRDDAPFKAVVDQATAKLFKSPEGAALYAKWFTSPIPPRNLNLNLPMAPVLAKAFANPSDSPDPAHYAQ